MIICDIDGCLFSNYHRSHLIPADRTRAENWEDFNKAHSDDLPVMPVINFVKNLVEITNQKVVFLTSRSESCKTETLNQLFQHFGHIKDVCIFMRPVDDHRDTVEFKKEKIRSLPLSFGVNSIIIDDNPEIIQMARAFFPKLNTLLTKSFDCSMTNRCH